MPQNHMITQDESLKEDFKAANKFEASTGNNRHLRNYYMYVL
jgi:hypothetical protein